MKGATRGKHANCLKLNAFILFILGTSVATLVGMKQLNLWLQLGLVMFLFPSLGSAASLTLQWDPVTTNVDGSPLTDLAGYNVYQRISSGSYGNPVGNTNSSTVEFLVPNLSDNTTYFFVVKAIDNSNNLSAASDELSVTTPPPADVTAPVRSNGQPSGSLAAGTTQATLSLATNEIATCRYSTSTGISYASMSNTFSSSNGTSHSSLVTGLQDGQMKNYYVRCIDSSNNANSSDFNISFSINTVTNTPPEISSFLSDKSSGVAPLVVSFTCVASDFNTSDVLTYVLDFGNGSTSSSASASTTYTASGNYTAKCTVNDGHGGSAMKLISISVSPAATPTPTATPTPAPEATPTPPTDQQNSDTLSSNYSVASGGCGQASSGHLLVGLAFALMLLGYRRRQLT